METRTFQHIRGTNLAYDTVTHIVYYKRGEESSRDINHEIMVPCFGPHDNLCRYENGQVVEMNGGSNVETTGE